MLDILTLPPEVQSGSWYIYNNAADDTLEKAAAALSFTCNAVLSQSATLVVPRRLDGGRVLHFNLHELCPRKEDFDKLWKALQNLQEHEFYFSQPSATSQVKKVHRSVPRYLASDGNYYDYVTETIVEHRKVEPGLHAGGAGPLLLLRDMAGGNLLPIVRGDWLIATAWTSVDIDGIKGSYYELAGIDRKPRGRTAFEGFLEKFGGDPKAVERLRSDQRTVMISGVTKRFRRIDMFPSLAVRPEFGPALITITRDLNNQSVDAKRHPLLNLLEFEDQAREIIAPGKNGLHRFLLTDGKGNVQDLAPDNVAVWRESPHPQSTQLINGISCLGCHGGNRGYNPTKNYVRELMTDGFIPVGDISSGLSYKEVYDRLRGLYDGEFDLPLKAAANGYALAMDKATWGVFGVKSVESASAECVRIWGDYFAFLPPEQVLLELGYEYKGKLPIKKVYDLVVPKVLDEDGRIALPRSGLPMTRAEMHQIYYEMSLRDVLKPKVVDPPARAPGPKQKPGTMIPKPGRGLFSVKPESPPPHTKPEWRNAERRAVVAVDRTVSSVDLSSVGRLAEKPRGEKEPAVRPASPRVVEKVRPQAPFHVEWLGTESPGFEWVAEPGSQLWYFNTYGGRLDASGKKFCGLRTMKPDEVWLGYELTLKKPSGEVLRGKVDLFGNRRIRITWR